MENDEIVEIIWGPGDLWAFRPLDDSSSSSEESEFSDYDSEEESEDEGYDDDTD